MIQPINNCYIVELIKHKQTESGLELPVKEEDKHLRTGKVVAIPHPPEDPNDIMTDSVVVFGEYAYDQLVYEGNLYCFVKYEDIIGIIK